MLLLINNSVHKHVRDNSSFNLRVYSEHSTATGKVFLALLYHGNANSLKIPLHYVIFVSLV